MRTEKRQPAGKFRFVACMNTMLCLLIALFLVLSESVCVDTAADTSFFSAPLSNHEDNSSVQSLHSAVKDSPFCTEEVSGMRGNICIRRPSPRFEGQGGKTGGFNGFQTVEHIHVKKYNPIYLYSEPDGYRNKYPEALITDFIHKSDGKKRIEPYLRFITAC